MPSDCTSHPLSSPDHTVCDSTWDILMCKVREFRAGLCAGAKHVRRHTLQLGVCVCVGGGLCGCVCLCVCACVILQGQKLRLDLESKHKNTNRVDQ